jgi:hypothetical protein
MLSDSTEKLLYNISQLNSVAASQVIEYDFYKIGYRVDTSEVFIECKSDGLTYLSDFDNDGIMDTVKYYLSNTEALKSTTNPEDRILYRSINQGNPQIVTSVVDFELTYRDTAGILITPTSELSDVKKRKTVRSIDVYVYLEAADPIDSIYQGMEWKRNLSLKNIY